MKDFLDLLGHSAIGAAILLMFIAFGITLGSSLTGAVCGVVSVGLVFYTWEWKQEQCAIGSNHFLDGHVWSGGWGPRRMREAFVPLGVAGVLAAAMLHILRLFS